MRPLGAETLFALGRALQPQLDYTQLFDVAQYISDAKTHPLFYQEDRRGP